MSQTKLEIRDWCHRILSAQSLEEKLFCPASLTDENPGAPLLWDTPSRPPALIFQKRPRKEKFPRLHELQDPEKRAFCLHRFASHELLAVEIMAYALLAFPQAPSSFRKALCQTLREEQEHVRLYNKRLRELGLELGDFPLHEHFWAHVPYLTTPLQYISNMSLTFEMANLDFAPLYGSYFLKHGDELSAQLMQRIFEDEIRHVSFGWAWFRKFTNKSDDSWNLWIKNLSALLRPGQAKGKEFREEGRLEAGISQDWIDRLRLL